MKRMAKWLACLLCVLLLASAADRIPVERGAASPWFGAVAGAETDTEAEAAEVPAQEDAPGGEPSGADGGEEFSPPEEEEPPEETPPSPEGETGESGEEEPEEQPEDEDPLPPEPEPSFVQGLLRSASGAFTLEAGGKLVLTLEAEGLNPSTVEFVSQDPGVAFVSGSFVIGISEGSTQISASGRTWSGQGVTASCEVRVTRAGALVVSVPSREVPAGETLEITLELKESGVSDPSIRWTSSAPEVARVDDGVMYALTPGSAVLTAACEFTKDGIRQRAVYSCPVQVYGLCMEGMDGEALEVGETRVFSAELKGRRVDRALYTWSSSNTLVAKVNRDGVVEGVGAGGAVITVICDYYVGGRLYSLKSSERIQVAGPEPVRFRLVPENGGSTISPGESLRLLVQSSGDGLEGYSIAWSSWDRDVAEVDAEGSVTGISSGVATIVASLEYVTDSGRGFATLSFEVDVD